MFCVCVCTRLCVSEINVVTLVTRESSSLYTIQSELHYKVAKEDKDAFFYCEVSYAVPGAVGTAESNHINITVHCESPSQSVHTIIAALSLLLLSTLSSTVSLPVSLRYYNSMITTAPFIQIK